jgi:hypothetical protein
MRFALHPVSDKLAAIVPIGANDETGVNFIIKPDLRSVFQGLLEICVSRQ